VPGEHGGEYFQLSDAGRRQRGLPRIDKHIYSRENGWAINALATLYAVPRKKFPRQFDLRGCLKSPDSVKFGDYTRSFQLPNTWAESYARTVSVEISGLFKHPLSTIYARVGDLFAWLCVASLLIMIAVALRVVR
jgi:hypothetical protein